MFTNWPKATADAADLAVALARRAALELRARLAARAAAAHAALDALDLDIPVATESRVLEFDLHIDAAVGAPLDLAPAPAGGRPAEERLEDVAEAAEVRAIEATSHVEPAESSVAVAVVGRALLGIRQHLVRLAGLLEAHLRPVLLIAVRVVLHRQAPEGLLDVLRRGVPGHPQHLVVVALRRSHIQNIVSRQRGCAKRQGPAALLVGHFPIDEPPALGDNGDTR